MFTTDDSVHLATLIDAFQVPMFVADADPRAQDKFTLRAINKAHSRASTVDALAVRDIPVEALLHAEDAKAVNANYARCIQSGEPLEYEENLALNGMSTRWHTTLVPTRSDSGRPRIIGNAVLVETQLADSGKRQVFEDINYFSVQSQFQLARVSAYLDALEMKRDAGVSPNDLQILSALCRTVDRSLEDIRHLAEPRASAKASGTKGFLVNTEAAAPAPDPVRRTLERLTTILSPIH